MKEKISYQTKESQNFQEEPHIAILLSGQIPKKWQVDLRWREDDASIANDAQHNLAEGLSFNEAIKKAKEWQGLLNVPVAKYKDHSIEILQKPEGPSNKDQQLNLKLIMYSNKTILFPTH